MSETPARRSTEPSAAKPLLPVDIELPKPDPRDLAMLAVQLATKGRKNSNPVHLLSEAYDLWHQAAALIEERHQKIQNEREAKAETSRAVAAIGRIFRDEVTFDEIISDGLLRKQVGKKGRLTGTATSLGPKGLENSLK